MGWFLALNKNKGTTFPIAILVVTVCFDLGRLAIVIVIVTGSLA